MARKGVGSPEVVCPPLWTGVRHGDTPVDRPVDLTVDLPGDGIDFALAAYREEGVWQVEELVHDVLGDVESLATRCAGSPATAARSAWSPSTRTSS